jgi:hypothetical protein
LACFEYLGYNYRPKKLIIFMGIKFNFNSKYTLDIAIRLSIQRALFCQVSSNIRMGAVDWSDEEKKILIRFYFDGEISEENRASANCVSAEVCGDFDEETQVNDECIRLDFSKRLPDHMFTLYRRKE